MNYGIQGNITGDLKSIVKKFEVSRAYEGPQITLTWEFYADSLISAFKIVKKEGAYRTYPDGTWSSFRNANVSSTGGGQAHNHGNTGAGIIGATAAETPTAFAPKYVDVIICAKD